MRYAIGQHDDIMRISLVYIIYYYNIRIYNMIVSADEMFKSTVRGAFQYDIML